MQAGVNAIEAAYVLMQRLRAYEGEQNRAERRHPAFAADNHPINVNIGTLEGGEWNSSVAAHASSASASASCRASPATPCAPRSSAWSPNAATTPACAAPARRRVPRLHGRWLRLPARPGDQPHRRRAPTGRHRQRGAPLRRHRADRRPALRARPASRRPATAPTPTTSTASTRASASTPCTTSTRVLALTIARWCGVEAKT